MTNLFGPIAFDGLPPLARELAGGWQHVAATYRGPWPPPNDRDAQPASDATECDCCLHIWERGTNSHVPAEFIWTCQPSGNEISLCGQCTAIWRANAEDDPGLAPSRIRSIGAES